MPSVGPFDGLLFDPSRVGDLVAVTAPPYDVIGPEEQRRLHDASPHNIALIDLGPEGSENKYRRAGTLLDQWREEGILRRVDRPAVYPYEMRFVHRGGTRSVRGVVVEVLLEPWGSGILPHERTMAAPIEDRLALMRATGVNLSPIYAVSPGPCPPQAELLRRATGRPPDREVVDESGVAHRLWVEDPSPELAEWHRTRPLMVADGHHRYQTALAFRDEAHEKAGPGPWDSVMMLLVDAAEDPPVLPIHRVVRADPVPELDGRRVRDLAEVLAWLAVGGVRFGAAVRRGPELEHLVGTLHGDPPAVAALYREVLAPMEGVREVRFVPDAAVAEEAVREGRAQLALFLPPAHVQELREVIESGGRLPEKSTYFWPKPRTGMVLRPLD